MAYSHRNAVRQWEKWKDQEEKLLRQYGIPEAKIQELRKYDWEVFKKERCQHNNETEWTLEAELKNPQELELCVSDVEALLNEVTDEHILEILRKQNPLTLQIVFLKTLGYSGPHIGHRLLLYSVSHENRLSRCGFSPLFHFMQCGPFP